MDGWMEGRNNGRKEEVSIKWRKGGNNIAIEITWKNILMVTNEFLELVKVSCLLSNVDITVTNCNFSACKLTDNTACFETPCNSASATVR